MKPQIPLILCFCLLAYSNSWATTKISPKILAKRLKKMEEEEVTFQDTLVYIWKKPLKWSEEKKYLRFETKYLRCIISLDNNKAIQLLKLRLKRHSPRYLLFQGTIRKYQNYLYLIEINSIQLPKYKRKKRH